MEKETKKKGKLSKAEFSLLLINFFWMVAVYFVTIYLAEYKGIVLPYQICTGLYCALAIVLAFVGVMMTFFKVIINQFTIKR